MVMPSLHVAPVEKDTPIYIISTLGGKLITLNLSFKTINFSVICSDLEWLRLNFSMFTYLFLTAVTIVHKII